MDYAKFLLLRNSREFGQKYILSPFNRWFESEFSYKGQTIIDFGSSINSSTYCKFLKDNDDFGPIDREGRYYGFDVDAKTRSWLQGNGLWCDFFEDDALLDQIDLVVCRDVYEHLAFDERGNFLLRTLQLLRGGGTLLLVFPFVHNLNLIYHWDEPSHLPVGPPYAEAAWIAASGYDHLRCFAGGYTQPFRPLAENILAFIRNLVMLLPPFWTTVIIAQKPSAQHEK